MSEELKPCPFCGVMPMLHSKHGVYPQCYCLDNTAAIDDEVWNIRPVEIKLRARVAELRAENVKLLPEIVKLRAEVDAANEDAERLASFLARIEVWMAKGNLEPGWYDDFAEAADIYYARVNKGVA